MSSFSALSARFQEYDWLAPPPLTPEQELWAEVLSCAIDDALGRGCYHNARKNQREKIQEKAKSWLALKEDNPMPFSCQWILEHLPCNAEAMQDLLIKRVTISL